MSESTLAKRTLAKRFKRETGVSIRDYRKRLTMGRAGRRLALGSQKPR